MGEEDSLPPNPSIERTLVVPNTRVIAEKYRLERLVGEGGMGSVYEAEHLGLGMKVAIKILAESFSEDQVFLKRFRREARASAAVNHPNVVSVTDTGTDEDGIPFLVMELLDGESLASVIRRERVLSPEAAADIIHQVLGGLAAAHDKGIVHRDLKPANVFLATDGEARQMAKILDFGISKFAADLATNVTAEGAVIGTPSYMAPEQVKGRSVEASADIYATGVILYRLTTGKLPFAGKQTKQIYERILSGDLIPPRQVRPGLSQELEAVILRAMAYEPADRYPDALSFRSDLHAAVPNLDSTGPVPVISRSSIVPEVTGSQQRSRTMPSRPVASRVATTPQSQGDDDYDLATAPTRDDRGSSAGQVPVPDPAADEKEGSRRELLYLALGGLAVLGLGGGGYALWSNAVANTAGGGLEPGNNNPTVEPTAPVVPPPSGPPLIYGVARYTQREAVEEDHEPLVSYLSESLGRPVELMVVEDYELLGKLTRGDIHLTALSAYRYVQAKNEVPGLRLVATAVNPGGSSYEGNILVRADSDIRTLSALESKKFCFVSRTSTSGYIYPRAVLRQAGIDPDTDFAETVMAGDHRRALDMLYHRECEGAAVYQSIVQESGLPVQAFRVIGQTPRIPYDAYCLAEDVSTDDAIHIEEALLDLIPDGERASSVLSNGILRGFVPADDANYDEVREIVAFLDAEQ